MHIQQNVSLLPYNTFGIDALAEQFVLLSSTLELDAILISSVVPEEKRVLGGGSNVLLTKDVPGLVILNRMKGIKVVKEDADHVWLEVAAGEVWHDLVMYAISKGWSGIENLALIPGTVGASPIQNIGAYGVEVKETIDSITGWHWKDKAYVTLKNADCHFGYRDSVFKHSLKDQVFITSVTFRLNKLPEFRTTYGAIQQELEKMGITELSIRAIADAVIAIRTSKLPDPKVIGNAGSFFKNPTITLSHFETLKQQYPAIPSYPVGEEMVKLPAGWLIEQAGWKGYRNEEVGVHAKQALVLVNYGKAKGDDIWSLSAAIMRSVKDTFGVELEREVQVW